MAWSAPSWRSGSAIDARVILAMRRGRAAGDDMPAGYAPFQPEPEDANAIRDEDPAQPLHHVDNTPADFDASPAAAGADLQRASRSVRNGRCHRGRCLRSRIGWANVATATQL